MKIVQATSVPTLWARPIDDLLATWERVHDAAARAERRRRLLAWAGVAGGVLATAGAVLAILGVTR